MILFYIFVGGYVTLITGIGYIASRCVNEEYINDNIKNVLHSL